MRDRNVFGIRRALPRMSWSPQNLYNLHRRSATDSIAQANSTNFERSDLTLFQQRWKSKQLTRAYHGDFINEKIFKRWYLPSTLPDVRPTRLRRRGPGDDTEANNKWVMRDRDAAREQAEREEDEKLAQAPVASLMFEEVERRIDVFIFRCCFAHSVYEARRLVIHGRVKLNGKKHVNANTRLAPGDMVSVDPDAIRFLSHQEYEVEDEAPVEMEEVEGSDESAENSSDNKDLAALNETRRHQSDEPMDLSAAALESGDPQQLPIENATPPPQQTAISSSKELTPFHLPKYAAPFLFIPAYIEVSFATCSAIYVRRPTARFNYSEIPSPYEADGETMRLTWEWYNKVRPRMRSKSQLARMPENRRETRVIPGIEVKPRLLQPLPVGTTLRAQMARNSVY